MKSKYYSFKEEVVKLRQKGQTYSEIRQNLGTPISKSTLSNWCKKVTLPEFYKTKVQENVLKNITKARLIAVEANRIKQINYLKSVEERGLSLVDKIKDKNTAKIALAALYLGEGAKNSRSGLSFGNSNPRIIKLYLKLLRYCYKIDESKFRCTVQCRADQNIEELEVYWSKITEISRTKFYKTRIDPRTIGKPSKKLDYKGVCRINYFSNDLFFEIKSIMEIIL
jgi:hypothetical protein